MRSEDQAVQEYSSFADFIAAHKAGKMDKFEGTVSFHDYNRDFSDLSANQLNEFYAALIGASPLLMQVALPNSGIRDWHVVLFFVPIILNIKCRFALNLAKNDLTNVDALALLEATQSSEQIITLNLGRNGEITDEMMGEISESNIRKEFLPALSGLQENFSPDIALLIFSYAYEKNISRFFQAESCRGNSLPSDTSRTPIAQSAPVFPRQMPETPRKILG